MISTVSPLLSHGTQSKVQFILTGDDDATQVILRELWYFVPVLNNAHCQVRTLSDSKKNFFKKGSLDTFLMTVEK